MLKFRETELQLSSVHLLEKNIKRFSHHGRLVYVGTVHFRLKALLLVRAYKDIDGTIVALGLR